MPAADAKPWLSFPEQAELLRARGMPDVDEHLDDLAQLGYYRLSGYRYPFRQIGPNGVSRGDHFFEGTTFRDVLALYNFDTRLRESVWACLSALEIQLRVSVGHELGRLDPFAHVNPDVLDQRVVARKFDQFRRSLESLQVRSKEDFVQHFLQRYDGLMPVWVATEIMQMGQLVTLFELAPFAVRRDIAERYGARADEFHSWLKSLNIIRNVVAHHGRLWNRSIGMKPQLSHRRSDPLLDHARGTVDRIYGVLAVMAYLLRARGTHDRLMELRSVLLDFPQMRTVSPAMMKMPVLWEQHVLWSPGWKLGEATSPRG